MQTMTDFEVICIDDGSTDVSLSILHSYAARDSRVRVFRTPMNLGAVSKVLNYALQFMRGNYFVYSSQDDLFSPDWLEKMHDRAIVTGSDAVIPDLVFFHANDSAKDWRLSGLHGNRDIELSGRDAMLYSLRWEIPGNALWKSELVKRLKFEEFGMNSDEFSARVFFLNCNKVVFCSGVFYYRQDNELAVTKKTTFKTFDYPYTQFRLYELVRDHQFPVEIVHREALKVLEIMNTLRQWLVQHPTELSVDDREQAEARMEKCVVCLRNDPMFAAVI
jgi:glycosyltransferase involved in cell wall biosynthesis